MSLYEIEQGHGGGKGNHRHLDDRPVTGGNLCSNRRLPIASVPDPIEGAGELVLSELGLVIPIISQQPHHRARSPALELVSTCN